jgi:hypothetical protein
MYVSAVVCAVAGAASSSDSVAKTQVTMMFFFIRVK